MARAETRTIARAGGRLAYSMYGLRVHSDLALGLPEADGASRAEVPDCVFEWLGTAASAPEPDGPIVAGLPCNGPCHNGRLVTRVNRGPRGTWFWTEAVGTCFVPADARRVSVY